MRGTKRAGVSQVCYTIKKQKKVNIEEPLPSHELQVIISTREKKSLINERDLREITCWRTAANISASTLRISLCTFCISGSTPDKDASAHQQCPIYQIAW